MKEKLAIRCQNVAKQFFIASSFSLWRLLLGLKDSTEGVRIDALSDISFKVPRGEFVGILGRNGAGKSTLLRVLGSVYERTGGHIEMLGIPAGLFELGGMGNPHLTGRQYAVRYLKFMGLESRLFPSTLEEIAGFSELENVFDNPIRTYSSGMAARLYFAVATATEHEIYLVDEVLTVGDEHFQAKAWSRIRGRLSNGASGVLVTHDWSAVLKLCTKAGVISGGTFTSFGDSAQVVASYLDLPRPKAENARFRCSLPTEHHGISGQLLSMKIPVEIIQPGRTELKISIEMLNVGQGWEIVILSDFIEIGMEPGAYDVNIDVEQLPLLPGRYSIGLFLNNLEISSDARSWTIGNGISLVVTGSPQRGNNAVLLPFKTTLNQRASG